jgi:hypothetical protein
MKTVDPIARVRREGRSIKEIVRKLHVSRNTVRKNLRSGATASSYKRERRPFPKIGPCRDQLDAILTANAAQPGRERLTLIRLFEELRVDWATPVETTQSDAIARAWHRARGSATVQADEPFHRSEPGYLERGYRKRLELAGSFGRVVQG